MIETVQLEVCSDCLVAVLTGRGPDHLLGTLWRKFRGGLVIFESVKITTFRACEACGSAIAGVRFGAIAVIRTGEDA